MVGPLAYIGGKNRLAAKIISLLPGDSVPDALLVVNGYF
jgi:site-specific DNA-adenine methylase